MILDKSYFGVSTLTWAGEPITTALRKAADLGFNKVDIGLLQNWTELGVIDVCKDLDGVVSSLSGAIERARLSVLSINTSLLRDDERFSLTDQAAGLCELAGWLRVKSGVTIQSAPADSSFEQVCAHLEPIYREFLDRQVTLMVETHKDKWTEVPANCTKLMERHDRLKLTLDASHFIIQGYDVADWEHLIGRTGHCHVRSCGEGGWKEVQVPASRCSPRVYRWLDRMQEMGYGGTMSFEMVEGFGVDDAPSETLRLLDRLLCKESKGH